jgi:hypothetical protein
MFCRNFGFPTEPFGQFLKTWPFSPQDLQNSSALGGFEKILGMLEVGHFLENCSFSLQFG